MNSLPINFPDMNYPVVNILGFPVARLSMKQVLEIIDKAIAAHNENVQQEKTLHIVTANAEILYRAYADPDLGKLLKEADLITPDGNGAVKAAQRLGNPVPERVTGVDLMWQLLPLAEEKGWRLYFLGAAEEVVSETVNVVMKKWPRLQIAGRRNGYFKPEEREQVITEIFESKAVIIFVALGFPAQDRLIIDMINKRREEGRSIDDKGEKDLRLPAVAIGVGGSFDAISGHVKRAPKWIQDLGLEWAYRFAQNPKRLKRASALPKFVLAVRKQVKRERGK